MDPARRVDELRQEIRRHEELYYVQATPEISDAQFFVTQRMQESLIALHLRIRGACIGIRAQRKPE